MLHARRLRRPAELIDQPGGDGRHVARDLDEVLLHLRHDALYFLVPLRHDVVAAEEADLGRERVALLRSLEEGDVRALVLEQAVDRDQNGGNRAEARYDDGSGDQQPRDRGLAPVRKGLSDLSELSR